MKAIIMNVLHALRLAKEGKQNGSYLSNISQALLALLCMSIVFSFASYGLKTYVWYFLAGLSVVVLRISKERAKESICLDTTRPSVSGA
jgi:hypothetical protein